jgi:hypothetical protein
MFREMLIKDMEISYYDEVFAVAQDPQSSRAKTLTAAGCTGQRAMASVIPKWQGGLVPGSAGGAAQACRAGSCFSRG